MSSLAIAPQEHDVYSYSQFNSESKLRRSEIFERINAGRHFAPTELGTLNGRWIYKHSVPTGLLYA